jgi:fatty-acyl-CoA synthase
MSDQQLTQIQQQLLAITRQFLLEQEVERALYTVSLDASLERQLGIDSLSKVELFHRVERALGVRFSDKVMAQADSLAQIAVAALSAKPSKSAKRSAIVPALESVSVDLSKVTTLQEALLQYAMNEPARPHIYFINDDDSDTVFTYGQLLAGAANIASALIRHGIQPGHTVALMLPTGAQFFQSFMGILYAGAIPVPIYPPFRPDQLAEYAVRETKILRNAEVRCLITFSKAQTLGKILRAQVPSLTTVTTATQLLSHKGTLPHIAYQSDHSALIQYTSGSTGDPKGVLLTHANILANITAVGDAIDLQATDVIATWLPLYHDMGLMSWLGGLYYGIPITMLSPIAFIHRPERWLWAIHFHRATISAGPNFAYELLIRKVDTHALAGLDLSCWRLALNGAEPVKASTLKAFYQKFKPYALREQTPFPVYGLAENTVALAFPPLHTSPRIDYVARQPFSQLGLASPSSAKDALAFVSTGKVIPRHELRITDDDDQILPERQVGHIQFRGPSAMQGYYRNPKATAQVRHGDWWDTGDLGYLAEGDLFVTGRKKDLIIKAGRNFYPDTIEDVVAGVEGIRKGCVAAFGAMNAELGTEQMVIVAESHWQSPESLTRLTEQVVRQVTLALGVPPDDVLIVKPHTIPKTSSGKLQRSACKQAYLQGTLVQQRKSVYWQAFKLRGQAMGRQLLHYARNIAKFCYTAYISVLIAILIIPIILSILAVPYRQAARNVKYSARLLLKLSFCPLTLQGKQNLPRAQQPAIYCVNHASYVDFVVLLAILPAGTLFIGKQELLHIPVIGRVLRKLRLIAINRWEFSKNIEDSRRIQEILNQRHSIQVFPEGTFTYASGLRPFKTGAFHLAVTTQTPICPIALRHTRELLRAGSFLLNPRRITVTIGSLLKPHSYDWQEVIRLRLATHKQIEQHCGEPSIDILAAGPEVE